MARDFELVVVVEKGFEGGVNGCERSREGGDIDRVGGSIVVA